MRMSTIFAIAALTACAPESGDAAPASDAAAERSIFGEYVITFVDQDEPTIGIEGHEPTVSISADRIHFQSQCIYEDWSYQRDGEDITTGPFEYDEPAVMCARGYAPGETAIIEAISGADTVRFIQGGLWFSGEGGTVQMRRVRSEAEVAGRDVNPSGTYMVQALDERVLPYPLELHADFEQIWWEPGCAGQSITYQIDGSAFAYIPAINGPRDVCDIGFDPELPQIWEAIAAADSIEATANGGILISGNGRSVLLAPASGAPQ